MLRWKPQIPRDIVRAMSQENVEIDVRAAFDALNTADLDAALKNAAPGFELDFSRAVGPSQGMFGRDELPGLVRAFDEPWESVRREADEFIEGGEHVVMPFTSYHRGRDGIEVRASGTLVWAIHNGAITRLTYFLDRQEALEAAGLSD